MNGTASPWTAEAGLYSYTYVTTTSKVGDSCEGDIEQKTEIQGSYRAENYYWLFCRPILRSAYVFAAQRRIFLVLGFRVCRAIGFIQGTPAFLLRLSMLSTHFGVLANVPNCPRLSSKLVAACVTADVSRSCMQNLLHVHGDERCRPRRSTIKPNRDLCLILPTCLSISQVRFRRNWANYRLSRS